MINVNLQPHSLALAVPNDEQIAAGVVPHVEVIAHIAVELPFRGPDGQAPAAPFGVVRMQLDKQTAVDYFRSALEAAEKLPDAKPSIQIAPAAALNEVEAAAERLNKLKGGGKNG